MPLEHADEEAMRCIEVAAFVRNLARDDAGALNIPMKDRTWRPLRLEPMQLLQIAEPDFGGLASVPRAVHPNERVLDRHGSLSRCSCTEYRHVDVCAIP
jgi:hypothetical protein